jgi:hypothetical protein
MLMSLALSQRLEVEVLPACRDSHILPEHSIFATFCKLQASVNLVSH